MNKYTIIGWLIIVALGIAYIGLAATGHALMGLVLIAAIPAILKPKKQKDR